MKTDVLIIGGGIAGTSLGARIAGRRQAVIVEAESHCGIHSTGRSAAFWLESYGGPHVAPLSRASREFLLNPPADFHERPFLKPRANVWIADEETRRLFDAVEAVAETRRIGREELERVLPGILPRWRYGLLEPGCADIDVAGLHAAFQREFRRKGGTIRCDARVESARRSGEGWIVRLENGEKIEAQVLVDAAGAWADRLAERCGVRPLGIAPMRRTMVQLRVGRGGLRELPLVNDAAGSFYFKGETDRSIWLSPHDEIASDPCDAQPEELDVAIAIDRFQQVVDWPVEAVERKWAGLRSFAPDRLPVYGWDPDQPGFFWCAGQGGFGIQTSPAAARLAAAVLLGEAPDVPGVKAEDYSPGRFS